MQNSNRSSLPTTVMERYFARPSHGTGMVFSITLVIKGNVKLESLKRAWFHSIEQHVRMFARLSGHGRRQRWDVQPCGDAASLVYREIAFDAAVCDDLLHDPDAESVNPRDGIGIKCVVQSSDRDTWSIRFLFHHACCDGVGAIRVLGQVMKSYVESADDTHSANRLAEKTSPHRAPAEATHANPDTAVSRQLPDFNNLWTSIRGTNLQLSRHIDPAVALAGKHSTKDCAVSRDTNTSIKELRGNVRFLFSPSASDQIRNCLREKNVNLNDWAIAVTLHCLARITSASASARRHVMIMNPVETRTWAQRRDTSNHIGIAFLRRTHDQLQNMNRTVESVNEQMTSVRQHATGKEMESGIAIAERIPGGLGLFERLGTFTPTAALTSVAGLRLGKRFGVTRKNDTVWIGSAELADVFFEGPIQAGGQMSITVWEFEGQIAISGRTTGLKFSAAEAEKLLTLWAEIATQSCVNDASGKSAGQSLA